MVEETGVEETPTEESPASEEKTVPYDRFKKVNEERKEAVEENKSLKEKPKEETQPDAEKQAKEYLSGLVDEELEKRDKQKVQTETDEQTKFESDVTELLDVHTDVKKDDFLKFIEENDEELEFSSPKAAMATYRKVNNLSKEAEEKVKDDLEQKPSLPRNEGVKTEAPIDDSQRSLEEVVQDSIKDLK